MRRLAALLAVLAVCVACAVPGRGGPADVLGWPTFPDPPATAVPAPEAAAYQQALDAFAAVGRRFPTAVAGASGVTAAVLGPRGAWAGASGVDGLGVPLRPDTAMGVGTLTVTATAAEVLHLAAQGRIPLDGPLVRVLPESPVDPAITVRQLLAMRAGLNDLTPSAYARLVREAHNVPFGLPSRADLLAALPPGPPAPAPTWSNIDYVLLAAAVERVTGQDLATAVRRDLLDPAGLAGMGLEPGRALAAPGPDADSGDAVSAPGRALAAVASGATGLTADAADLARWGWVLYGARVLPPPAVAAMTTAAGPGRIDQRPYGLGTMLYSRTIATGDAYGHIGREPGWTSVLVVQPDRPVAVAVLAVGGDRDVTGVARALFLAAERSR